MIKFFTCLFSCFFALTAFGQKANYKQAEWFMKCDARALVGSTSVRPTFLKDSEKFWYSFQREDGTRYYFVDPKTKSHREMFDREFLAGEISKVTHKPVNKQELPIGSISFKEDEKTMKFMVDTFHFEYNINTKKFVTIDTITKKKPTPPSKKKFVFGTYSPDSTYVVYAKSHNLYLFRVKDSVVQILSLCS